MQHLVVRVWLPDRPGALGQVASRIGAVRGDVEAIDILESGAGRAIDELVVGFPDAEGDPAELVALLVAEIRQVDGVSVESVRVIPGPRPDQWLTALEVAAGMAAAGSATGVIGVLARGAALDLDAPWAAVVRLADPEIVVGVGDTPTAGWLAAFVEGSRHLDHTDESIGPSDVLWAVLPATGLALIAGRPGAPFRWKEKARMGLLAKTADALIDRAGADRSTAVSVLERPVA